VRTYQIKNPVFEAEITIDVAKHEFEQAARGINALETIVAIEEKLDIVLENFREYEEELLRLALYHSHHRDLSWTQFRLQRHVVNRRILNVLSAARMYIDQVRADVAALYGTASRQYEAIVAEMSARYDESIAYRVMEVLRNHVQHHSLPISEVVLRTRHEPFGNDPFDERGRLRYSVIPELDLQRLKSNQRLKQSIVRELVDITPRPALTHMLRQYVGSLGLVHERLRTLTDGDCDHWISLLVEMRERAKARFETDLVGVVLIEREGKDILRELSLQDEVVGRRETLRKINRNFMSFAIRYAASET